MTTRYHGVYKKPYIKEEQTIQWPQDTMGPWYLVVIVLSVLLWYTASYKPHGILWSLYCLSFFDIRLLINLMVSCGHCIFCSSLKPYIKEEHNTMTTRYHGVYKKPYIKEGQTTQWPQDTMGFIRSRISKKDRQHNDHKIPIPHGILWSLYCLFFFDIRPLINPMVSCGHCVVCPSLIYGFL
jgi:hypothetical protein